MALYKRNRIFPVDILQVDYEYCNISYYAAGERNDLGEPSRVLTQRSANVKCSIYPITRTPNYIGQGSLRIMLQQGIVEKSSYIMILLAEQEVVSGDIITDYDGNSYDVLHVINWYTHKEAFLRRMN